MLSLSARRAGIILNLLEFCGQNIVGIALPNSCVSTQK